MRTRVRPDGLVRAERWIFSIHVRSALSCCCRHACCRPGCLRGLCRPPYLAVIMLAVALVVGAGFFVLLVGLLALSTSASVGGGFDLRLEGG